MLNAVMMLWVLPVFIMGTQSVSAQNIDKAEYFYDTDPGVGLATPITIGTPFDSVSVSTSIAATGLSTGYHYLFVRTRTDEGKWSLHEGRRLYIEPTITAAEYFFDTDPGVGNAAALTVATSYDSVSFTGNISVPALTPGNHWLFVRTKNNSGTWSLHDSRMFFVKPTIVAAEYFVDADPGVGHGTSVAVTASLDSVALTVTANTGVLATGWHSLFVRTKSNSGGWSLYEGRKFFVRPTIVAAEYFVDADPGVGHGTPVPVTVSFDSVGLTATANTGALATGWHSLFVRSKNNSGTWSLYEGRKFFVKPTIVAAEYFVDADPGVGHGTSVPVTVSFDSVALAATANTGALTTGWHSLFVRTKNNTGIWSLYEGRKFFVKPTIVAAEYFIDADPGAGHGNTVPVSPTYDSVVLTASVATGAIGTGWHYLFVRTKNNDGAWSLYEGRKFYRKPIITAAEYFVDVDPGVGAASPFTFAQGYDSVIVNTIANATCLDSGQHFLFIRTRDEKNNWSLYEPDTFFINLQTPVIVALDTTAICTGSSVRLKANLGAACGYQWYKNNTAIAGATDSFYTAATIGNYNVQVTIGNSQFFSNNITVTAGACTSYVWTGANSTDWALPTNWNPTAPAGGPNNCALDVIIPVTSNNPVISTAIGIGNIQINATARLTLNGINFNVCGNLTGGTGSNATIDGSGIIVLNGSSAQAISGKTAVQELLLDNTAGASMQSSSSLDVSTALDLKAGNFNATGGALTFKSTSVTSAGIIDNFSSGYTGTLTGNIAAERYYATSLTFNQHYMGSPVNTPPLSQFNPSGTAGFVSDLTCDELSLSHQSNYGTVFSLHESNGAQCGIQQWKVETTGNIQNGLGYSILKSGNGTLTLNGAANLSSSYSVTGLTNSNWSNTTLQNHTESSGWQLVSNPYLATLNLTTIPVGFDGQVQVWNANGPFAGSYQPGTIGTDATIAPFQAFMIHKTAAGGTATFTMNAIDRVRAPQRFFAQNANQLNIIASNVANGMLDQTMVAFNPVATDTFDVLIDAAKLPGALSRQTLYTVNNGKWMSRNTLHDEATTSTVPMGFEPGANGTYKLSFNGLNTFDPTSYIYLEDKTLNLMYNVRSGDYTFTADSADNWNRFVLHFTPAALITTADASCSSSGTISVRQPGAANWNYTITDSSHVIITSGTLNQNQAIVVGVAAGIYTLTLIDTNSYTVTKTIFVNGPETVTAVFQANHTVIETGQTVTFTSTDQGSANYQWNLGNGTTATGAVATVSYATPGVYMVSLLVTSPAGCTATQTQPVTVNAANTTGQYNINTGKLKIWSNSNRIYVDFTSQQLKNTSVIIYDVLGQEISDEKVVSNVVYQKAIDNMEAAYIVVMVKNDNEITTQKVFIDNVR